MSNEYRFLFGREDNNHIVEYAVPVPGEEPQWRRLGGDDCPTRVTWRGSFNQTKTVLFVVRATPGWNGQEHPRQDAFTVVLIDQHHEDKGEELSDADGLGLDRYIYFRGSPEARFERQTLKAAWGR